MMIKSPFKTLSISAISMLLASAPSYTVAQDVDPITFADIQVCLPGLVDVPLKLREASGINLDEQPTEIQADEIEAVADQRAILKGNAQIIQGSRGVYADEIEYNQETYQARASGNVKLYSPNGDEIVAESMNIEVDTFIGDAEDVSVTFVDTEPDFIDRRSDKFEEDYSMFAPFTNIVDVVEKDEKANESVDPAEKKYYHRARAKSKTMQFEGEGYEVLQDAVMTTCPVGNQDVTLSAKEIQLDHGTGIGTAKNMTVRLKSIPIFFFPTVSFPINDERKTGFLFPAIGEEDESGFILEVPYYINIAPQMDATVTPRLLSERGVQVYSEFRYIAKQTEGVVRAEYLPSDKVFNDEDRYAFGFDHRQTFAKRWRAEVDLQDVSDSDYLRDFANNVDIVASSYVPQRARLTHSGKYTNFSARAQKNTSVNDEIGPESLPYEILPELTFDVKPQSFGIFEAGLNSEFTEFDAEDSTRVIGNRTRIEPYIALPLEKIYGFLIPKIGVHNIGYSLDNVASGSGTIETTGTEGTEETDTSAPTSLNNTVSESSPSASIPVFSLDSGLIFERLFSRGDTPYYQTLEPRIFYLNIPEEADQNAFPVFDTGEVSFNSFSQFFRENRFFGGDRVGDTEQLSLGLTSRIMNDDTGGQKMKASIGQILYLDDRNIRLDPDSAPLTSNRSDSVAELTANLNPDWSTTAFARWDNEEDELGSFRFSVDYYNSHRRNASLAYTESNNDTQQINLDFDTPLGPRWQLDVETAYSLEESELRSSAVGVSYDGCCWAVRLGTQRYLDGRGEYKNRYLFTIELDDLGRIRSKF
jgi:LPS-assembly protein